MSKRTIGRKIDFARMARALARPEMDTRHWISYGTVAAMTGSDGTPNFEDPTAILVSPAGVEVDVVLEPMGYPITCRYGIAAGSCNINTPIRPGDQVVVAIPDGDASMIPQIVAVISGSSDPMPVGDDGLPIFKNDRLMIYAGAGIPIEIRSADGTMVRVTDGLVELGGQGVTEENILGTTYTSDEGSMFDSLLEAIVPAASACHLAVSPATALTALQALATMLDAFTQAITTFQGQAAGHLSQVVKTK